MTEFQAIVICLFVIIFGFGIAIGILEDRIKNLKGRVDNLEWRLDFYKKMERR